MQSFSPQNLPYFFRRPVRNDSPLKVEREERENALKAFRSGEATETLDQQVAFKRAHEASEREQILAEKEPTFVLTSSYNGFFLTCLTFSTFF